MSNVKILVFAGSAREGSLNKMFARLAAEAIRGAGAQATFLDLRDLPMPLFDSDLEANGGMPANAKVFKEALLAHDGLLICSPEYNSSVTPLLKNAIDWASRAAPGETALAAFQGKVAALLSASPGALGGLRGLVHLRAILGNIGVLVLPEQLALGKAHEAFDAAGKLKDAKTQASLASIAAKLANTAGKLKG